MKESTIRISCRIIMLLAFNLVVNINLIAQDGLVDNTFSSGLQSTEVRDIQVQNDSKILIGGSFVLYFGQWVNDFTRLNIDGQRDTSFNTGNGPNSRVRCIQIQNDGKILIGGDFTEYNGVSRKRIARVNANGTLDNSFDPGTGFNGGEVRDIVIDSSGKILIAGAFTTFNGISRNRIARLNSDGTLDSTFNPVSGANATINSICIQSDGNIIAAGIFTTFNGSTRNYLTRITTTGSDDPTFNPGIGPSDYVNKIVIQSDGKIVIGGTFHFYEGQSNWYIARVNINGTLDTSFFSGFNFPVHDVLIQPNNQIVVVGDFTYGLGQPMHRIARLNLDGSVDGTFQTLSGADDIIYTVAIQSDWKLLIGGEFNQYDTGATTKRLARINNTVLTSLENLTTKNTQLAYPNPVHNFVTINHTSDEVGKDFTLFDYTGRIIISGTVKETKFILDLSTQPVGLYFYKLDNSKKTLKIVKDY